jgi:RHS repeat-associated protein
VYDAFGAELSATGTWKGPFGYAGGFGYQEDSSGLKLLGHRYYDPTTGRFLSRDPIMDGQNWYAYCGNEPVRRIDPEGLAFYDDPDHPGYNAIVGFGDGVSFGLTNIIRERMGTDSLVAEDSLAYQGGRLGGEVVGSYIVGAGAGKALSVATKGKKIRLGGKGTNKYHKVRIETGSVHVLPGVRESAVKVAHFHIMTRALEKLHLPYQLWPWIQGGRFIAAALATEGDGGPSGARPPVYRPRPGETDGFIPPGANTGTANSPRFH